MEINPSPPPPPPPAPPNISPDPSLNHPGDHKAPPLNDDDDDDVTLGLTSLHLSDQDPHSDSDSEFTFMCVIDAPDADEDSVTTESDKSGTTRPVFPLFDQSLLLPSKDDRESRLTSHVPVNKVFIETSPSTSSSTSSSSSAATVICASVSKEEAEPAEINIKSNSTGFSKLWRFRNEMNRSNSDGRDAYVFLQTPNNNNSKGKTSVVNDAVSGGKANKKKENDVVEGEEGKGKKAAAAVVKKGGKVKKSTESAHEVYLKQKKKSGKTEEERRRSYLPYRPGLMGFFTNVNGGLSKNVHPF